MNNSFDRYSDKNRYGGYTWVFQLGPIYHIFVYSTMENTFVIDFREWGFFKYRKTHFSFTSKGSLLKVVEEAAYRSIEFLENNSKYQTDKMMYYNKMKSMITQLESSKDSVTQSYIY